MLKLTRKCPYCETEFDRFEDKCPGCKQTLPKDIPWWIYLVGALIVASLFVGLTDWGAIETYLFKR